jgi:putative membrane protein
MDGPAPRRRRRDPVSASSHSDRGFLLALAIPFGVLWVLLAVRPNDRSDWLLENALTLAAIALLAITRRPFPLQRRSYLLITLFLVLHTIGAHYTYAEVPYDAWTTRYLGFSVDGLFGWQRNNFDRVVHLAYGLLLALPIREVFLRLARVDGFWGYFLPLDLTMSTSMLYELIEWGAATLFGGDLGMAYLGTQGDVWDAHKDMALASLGALLTMCLTALLAWRAARSRSSSDRTPRHGNAH